MQYLTVPDTGPVQMHYGIYAKSLNLIGCISWCFQKKETNRTTAFLTKAMIG